MVNKPIRLQTTCFFAVKAGDFRAGGDRIIEAIYEIAILLILPAAGTVNSNIVGVVHTLTQRLAIMMREKMCNAGKAGELCQVASMERR